MPYTWTEPDVFLSHKGVNSYYIYQDDCAENPVREYWYGFFTTCADEIDEGSFDIREVEALLPSAMQRTCNGDHQAILSALIDTGFLTEYGFMIEGYLCDSASRIQDAVNAYTTRQLTLNAQSLVQNALNEQEVG